MRLQKLELCFVVLVLFTCGCQQDELEPARQFMASEELDKAERALDIELKVDPDNTEARLLLGEVQLLTGDWAAAEETFDEALRSGGSDAKSRIAATYARAASRFYEQSEGEATDPVRALAGEARLFDPEVALDPQVEELANRIPDSEAARITMARMRDMGTALFAWVTDQFGGAAAGQQVHIRDYGRAMTEADLEEILVPQYLQELALIDGWGNELEYYVNVDKLLTSPTILMIRSAGSDGVFEGDSYTTGAFPWGRFENDIVWIDGFFTRYPERQ